LHQLRVQIVDLLPSSLRQDFDRAIGVVAHPTGDSQDVRLPFDKPTKADALDATADQEATGLN
jgi:hypothetical protein